MSMHDSRPPQPPVSKKISRVSAPSEIPFILQSSPKNFLPAPHRPPPPSVPIREIRGQKSPPPPFAIRLSSFTLHSSLPPAPLSISWVAHRSMMSARAFRRLFLLGLALTCAFAPAITRAGPPGEDPVVRLKEIVAAERKLFAKAEAAGDALDQENLRSELQQLANDYDKLILQHKDFTAAYVAYGLMLGKAGMKKESVAMLLRANQLDKDIPVVKNQLGNFLAEEGNPLEAVNYYLAAIKLAPEEPLYHYQLGMLLTEARDDFLKSGTWTRPNLDETLHKAFARAMELAPDDWRYAYQYGLSFYELQTSEWEAALQFWRAFEKKLKPGVEQEVCRLHQAKVLHELRRTDEARTLLASVNEPALARQRDKISASLDQPVVTATPPAPPATPPPAAPDAK